jgi:predicted nucleotidyltransferase
MTNLINRHRDGIADLCQKSSTQRLEILGFVLRSDLDPAMSDPDFLVELDDVSPAQYTQAYFSLKEDLEALFCRPIDLVTSSSLTNPYFRDRIAKESRSI